MSRSSERQKMRMWLLAFFHQDVGLLGIPKPHWGRGCQPLVQEEVSDWLSTCKVVGVAGHPPWLPQS